MKPSFGVNLMNQKILMSVILFSVILFYPFYYDEGYNETDNQKNESCEPEIVPGFVVIKLKSETPSQFLAKGNSTTGILSIDSKLQQFNVINISKMFKHKPIPANSNIPDISRFIKVQISKDINPLFVIRALDDDPNIEYAEPIYKRYFFDIPNDPEYPQQNYFQQIKAPEAWDIQKGDSNVVIAIIDGGVDYLHEDLVENLWVNEREATGIEGIDDDGNGFIDDIHGWDFGNNDSDPINSPFGTPSFSHGTGCAGVACAVTNNNIGTSSISWNCEFMPIKAKEDNSERMMNGFEGIVYAVDNGATILSNSWGSPGYSKWEQEIINYAYSKGVIIIFAAGNTTKEEKLYPASYQHVISVSAVDNNDIKREYSSFGPWVDISAPDGILTTFPGNNYNLFTGTSCATPLVAGVFGLLKSYHPEWNNEKIIKQILLTSDDITKFNSNYDYKLGHGRINALNALVTNELIEADARLDVFSYEFDDSLFGNNNGIIDRDETIQLIFDIQNFSISDANDVYLKLTCNSNDIKIVNENFGPLTFPADTILSSFEFLIQINKNAEVKTTDFLLEMTTTKGYYRSYLIPISIGQNPVLFIDHDLSLPDVEEFYKDSFRQIGLKYENIDITETTFPNFNTLKNFPITIMSCSFLGSEIEDYKLNEIIKYLDIGGNLFICGQDIANSLLGENATPISQKFFNSYLHTKFIKNNSEDDRVEGVLNDPIGDSIEFKIWQPFLLPDWQSPDVLEPLNLSTSIFNYSDGNCAGIKFSGDHKVVYLGFGLESIDSDENTQIGDMSPIRTKVLMRSLGWLNFIEHKPLKDTTNYKISRKVVTNVRKISPKVNSMILLWKLKDEENFNSLPMQNKYDTLYIGEIPGQNNPSIVEYYIETEFEYYTWTNPINAPENLYSYKGGNITDIEAEENRPFEFNLSQNYPNPFNPSTTIKYSIPEQSYVTLKLYDIIGREVAILVNEEKPAGNYKVEFSAASLPSGIYFYRAQAGTFNQVRKMLLIK